MKTIRRLLASTASLCLLAIAGFAQTNPATSPPPATPAAPGSTSSGDQTVVMSQVEVTEVPIDQQVLPTARPFNSVFGMDDDILDVPRNVTIVSRAQMDDINIQDVTDFSKLTSSSYTDSDFGSPANPTIRGQPADVFINGMREHVGDNGDGIPLDFNLVESVNIVPGPATAVQGASPYVGGFADFITKQPFFDGDHGSISYTYGSYDANRWTVDLGGPASPTLAYRFSYSGEDSDSFWYYRLKQTTSIYGAIEWRPNKKYDLFLSVNGFVADYRENFGINRPTQALISDGLYQSGTNVNNGTKATASDPQNAFNVGGGPGGSDVIAFGPVVPIDYRVSANGPLSHAHGQEYDLQAIQTDTVSTNFKIVDNTIYSYTKRDTYNADGYNEVDDPTVFLDNRTEFIVTLGGGEINTGLEERYQHVIDYTDFFFEPVNVWDLSTKALLSDINFQKSQYFATSGALPIPGWPGRYAIQGIYSNDTNNSELSSVSPYAQSSWKLASNLTFVIGARMDIMHLGDIDPLTPGGGGEANLGFAEPNANASLVYKITPTVSTYVTGNFSENYTGDLADGGGFGLYTDANGNATLPRSLFSEESNLFEYGVKTSAAGKTLFITSDVFYQTRQNKPQGTPAIQYQYYGFETSANYQPNKFFYATLGYSWINGSLPASANPYQAYDTNQIPGGPPNPYGPLGAQAYPLTGRLRAPGQPLDTINALVSYRCAGGFGLEANALVTSPMSNDYWGYLVIPWQYEIDATLSYKWKNWDIRATVTNLTNQHNWQPSDATYGLEGIVSEPTIQGFATIRYKY